MNTGSWRGLDVTFLTRSVRFLQDYGVTQHFNELIFAVGEEHPHRSRDRLQNVMLRHLDRDRHPDFREPVARFFRVLTNPAASVLAANRK
jgi:hypothetical protein